MGICMYVCGHHNKQTFAQRLFKNLSLMKLFDIRHTLNPNKKFVMEFIFGWLGAQEVVSNKLIEVEMKQMRKPVF